MSVRTAWLACLLCLFGATAHTARAQDGTKLLAAPEAPKAPTAIPVSDLADRADVDERFAEQVIRRSNAPLPTPQLASRLDAIASSASDKSQLLDFNDMRSLPVLRLESLERHWKFDARQFESWRADLQALSKPFIDDAAELAVRRADWQATHASAKESGLAPALDQRVMAVDLKLKEAEQAVSKPLSTVISLRRRASPVEAEIEDGEQAVTAAIDYIDRSLFKRNSPPLWRATLDSGVDQGAVSSMNVGASIETSFLEGYMAADMGNQKALRVFEIALLPLLLWLAWRERRRRRAGKQDDRASRVFSRPVSSWLLLSMMALLLLEPDAPLMLHQLAMLVAIVPVLRMLPLEGYRLLGRWPYVATALYVLLRLSFAVAPSPTLYRWYLLLLSLVAIGLTLWLLWRARHLDASGLGGRLGRFIHVMAWASVGVLALSAAANVLGATNLAAMLVGGVIDSGYMGLVLYAGVTVFGALIGLLIERREKAHFRFTRQHAQPLLNSVMRFARIAAVVGWIAFTMNRFRVFRPAYAAVESVLTHKFTFGEITLTLGHVGVFVISVFIAFWAAKTVRYILEDEVLVKMSLPRGVANSVASLTYYAMILLGLLFALAAAGFEVSQLAFVFGALGVGIGLGLQDVVKNFVSGLILMFERPIQPGDVVDVTGASGRVREIGMRATTIKTFDGADVVVPNGSLLANNVTNWTLRDMFRRIEVQVGVAYGSDPAQVTELLFDILKTTDGVADNPAPMVLFTGFGASSLDFVARAWTRDYENWTLIRSNLMVRAYAAMNEAGIEIPFPQQDLHLRTVSEEAGAVLGRHRGGREPAPQAPPRREPDGDPGTAS